MFRGSFSIRVFAIALLAQLFGCVKDLSEGLNYTVKDGEVIFTFTAEDLRNYSKGRRTELDDFTDFVRQRLEGVDSIDFGSVDGWKLVQLDTNLYQLVKRIDCLDGDFDYANKMMLGKYLESKMEYEHELPDYRFGFTQFRINNIKKVDSNKYLFYLPGYLSASEVFLSGSFNDWNTLANSMHRTDSGWIEVVELFEGKHGYKFIIDGQWTEDQENPNNEVNEVETLNSIFVVPNHTFKYPHKERVSSAVVSGEFVDWNEGTISMKRRGKYWVADVYLSPGSYQYKFIITGVWILDPLNQQFQQNDEYVNSVINLGNEHRFYLEGVQTASEVLCTGTFNGWSQEDYAMDRLRNGWEYNLLLPPGNYEYKYIVDGKWINDPDNPYRTNNEHNTDNTWLAVDANYTFQLKGFEKAREVYVSGEFVNWAEYKCKMTLEDGVWKFPVHLDYGKQLYKFQVDGIWMTDPNNKWIESNDHGTYNSVLWITR